MTRNRKNCDLDPSTKCFLPQMSSKSLIFIWNIVVVTFQEFFLAKKYYIACHHQRNVQSMDLKCVQNISSRHVGLVSIYKLVYTNDLDTANIVFYIHKNSSYGIEFDNIFHIWANACVTHYFFLTKTRKICILLNNKK